MKFDWGRTIFVAMFAGICMGLIAKSTLFGVIIFVGNIIGGVIYGLIFGRNQRPM
jgi:uncharacterized protein (DUF697 family)